MTDPAFPPTTASEVRIPPFPPKHRRAQPGAGRVAAALAGSLVLAGCASAPPDEPAGSPRPEHLLVLTAGQELLRLNAGRPQQVLQRRALTGLAAGERLLGIDFRVARGVLYGLSSAGALYTVDPGTGAARRVGTGAGAAALQASPVLGFNFNPVYDRIRVVAGAGANLRLHPDTGAQVDGDPARDGVQPDTPLHYAAGDAHAGRPPAVTAVAYTYNRRDDKLTTNYAIDLTHGVLAVQGSLEGSQPVLSPNGGRLHTVGALGLGSLLAASLDIGDVSNAAYLAVRTAAAPRTTLHAVELASGRTTRLGTLAAGDAVLAIAVEP